MSAEKNRLPIPLTYPSTFSLFDFKGKADQKRFIQDELVARDQAEETVAALTYISHQEIAHTLTSLAFDLIANPADRPSSLSAFPTIDTSFTTNNLGTYRLRPLSITFSDERQPIEPKDFDSPEHALREKAQPFSQEERETAQMVAKLARGTGNLIHNYGERHTEENYQRISNKSYRPIGYEIKVENQTWEVAAADPNFDYETTQGERIGTERSYTISREDGLSYSITQRLSQLGRRSAWITTGIDKVTVVTEIEETIQAITVEDIACLERIADSVPTASISLWQDLDDRVLVTAETYQLELETEQRVLEEARRLEVATRLFDKETAIVREDVLRRAGAARKEASDAIKYAHLQQAIARAQEQVTTLKTRIHSGEEITLSHEENEALFDTLFQIDPREDQSWITQYLRYLRKEPSVITERNKYDDMKRDEQGGLLKYTQEQLKAGDYDEADMQYIADIVKRSKIKTYFSKIVNQYEGVSIVSESIIRKTQEEAIARDLAQGKAVVLRGHWRMGLTSFLDAIGKHHFSANSVLFSAQSYGASPEKFKKTFGSYPVADFIAKDEQREGRQPPKDRSYEIIDEIIASRKTPFEFLNDYVTQKGTTVVVGIDEVINLEDLDMLRSLASLQSLDHIHPLLIVHRIADMEEAFTDIFQGYTTHFIEPTTLAETALLARTSLEGTYISFTDGAVRELHRISGGRPVEINALCDMLLDQNREERHSIPKIVYNTEDIRRVFEYIVSQDIDEGAWHAIKLTYSQLYEHGLTAEERVLLEQLQRDTIPIEEINPDSIKGLEQLALVRKDEGTDSYQINGEYLRSYVEQFAPRNR